MKDRGLFIGRFQPFHAGHLDAVRRLADQHDELVIGIGSANVSHTATNPFTAGERLEMIQSALAEAGVKNVVIVPIPDVGRNAVWVGHVRSLVPRFSVLYTNNPLPARLFNEAGLKVAPVAFHERDTFEGTLIRRSIANDEAWRAWVPKGVARVIDEVDGVARLRALSHSDGVVEGSDPSVQ